MFERSSGILMHPTSLPGRHGIGDLGEEAYKFINFLINSGQKLWQIFPLGPTGYGDSPYQCFSAFAGNPLLISLKELEKEGLLTKADLSMEEELEGEFEKERIDYGKVLVFKNKLLKKSYENFKIKDEFLLNNKFKIFCDENLDWLNDYALFRALKTYFGEKCWCDWEDKEVVLRHETAMEKYKSLLADEITFQKFIQFLFFKQWLGIKNYANSNGIKIIGDIPIFISYDSSDAWANPELFLFDEDRKPLKVAGVPPDYFSETGQLWGNPLYNWDKMKENNFEWWINRIKANFKIADLVRIDHFRGFVAYWGVDAHEETAVNGQWYPSPGKELFETIEAKLGKLPIIAEDLGVITPDVEELRDHFNFPGMKILQFSFNETSDNEHNIYNIHKNTVVYTGTHDNNTSRAWYDDQPEQAQEYIKRYLNIKGNYKISWELIQSAFASPSNLAIVPIQDVLNVGEEGRMNTPGLAAGNWQWRFNSSDLNKNLSVKLREVSELYFR